MSRLVLAIYSLERNAMRSEVKPHVAVTPHLSPGRVPERDRHVEVYMGLNCRPREYGVL